MAEEKVMEKKAEPKEPKAEAKAEMKAEKSAAAPMKEKPAKKSSAEALMTSEDKAPKKEAKSEKKGKGGGFTETVVQHHNMGGHHVHHKHKDSPDKDVHYAAQDLEGVKAGLDQHIGGGAGQMMAEAPEPAPAPAAEPMASAAPPAGAMPTQA
jgi:hypothetical protein